MGKEVKGNLIKNLVSDLGMTPYQVSQSLGITYSRLNRSINSTKNSCGITIEVSILIMSKIVNKPITVEGIEDGKYISLTISAN